MACTTMLPTAPKASWTRWCYMPCRHTLPCCCSTRTHPRIVHLVLAVVVRPCALELPVNHRGPVAAVSVKECFPPITVIRRATHMWCFARRAGEASMLQVRERRQACPLLRATWGQAMRARSLSEPRRCWLCSRVHTACCWRPESRASTRSV